MHIFFNGKPVEIDQEQTVLSALLDQGYDIPNICQAGACQSCMLQATEGEIPEEAQLGIKDTLKSQGYFLACCCRPESPLHITDKTNNQPHLDVQVIKHTLFNENTLCLHLQPPTPFNYKAGQFITLWKDKDTGRSYSLASVPDIDNDLVLHIGRIKDGKVSNWLFDNVKLGDTLHIQVAAGECFYTSGNPEQPLLLAGTGTGLAPLYGIARDALHQGHQGDIHLFHGAVQRKDLYLHQNLLDLQAQHKQFHYHSSVLQKDQQQPPLDSTPINEQILTIDGDLSQYKVYLSGAPDIVNTMKNKLFLAGVSIKNIYSDPFIAADS